MTSNVGTETFSASIAAAVRAELSRQGKPRTAIAEVISVSRPTAYSRLNGTTSFTSGELEKVARFLGITPFDLIESASLGQRFADRTARTSEVEPSLPRDPLAQPARSRSKRGAA